jgi:beta-N-acetylhexosaminidase
MHRRTALSALTLGLHSIAGLAQRRPAGATPPPPPAELLALAGQCLLVGWRTRSLHPWVAHRVAEGALGAVIVTHGNAPTAAGLRALCGSLNALVPAGEAPMVIACDQEGGAVSHLSPPLTRFPSLTTLGAVDDVALTARVAAALARSLAEVGVGMNLAPVLDVCTDPNNGVVPGRVFGGDPEKVARHGEAFVAALQEAGVLACAKHFPGHGGTREDSHRVLPSVAATVESLRRVELVPFAAVARTVAAVMVAHVVYEGVDRDLPATLSRRCSTELLRDVVGVQGVAVTDDLEMTPIRTTWGVADAAVRAMAAGNDLITIAHSPSQAELARVAMARRAAADDGFRERLTAAAERVRALRRRVTAPGALAPGEDLAALLAEVRARAPRRAAVFRDPTREPPGAGSRQ